MRSAADVAQDLVKILELPPEEVARYKRVCGDLENQPEWFIEVAQLTAGQSFGELALINDAKRAATIQCLTDCFFAVIDRENYEKTLKRIELRAVQNKVNFFRSLPFVKHWTLSQVQKLVYMFSERRITRNQTLYQQGEEVSFVYIVKSGEFEIVRSLKKHEQKAADSFAKSRRKIDQLQATKHYRSRGQQQAQEVRSFGLGEGREKVLSSESEVSKKFKKIEKEEQNGPSKKNLKLSIVCAG
jgi:hypothetical protein